ncbi:thymidylate kinase [Gemmatimonadetes bacterium T265]|nr:thymidylate kinase [Gemmatimonadetes bacterium T265]
MEPPGGRLVVFEGAEGVGKSTQVARLAATCAAAGLPAASYREPGATALGERVRALLLDPGAEIDPRAEALLFIAARAQLVARVADDLAVGTFVVLDRFFLSTYAYQIAGRGLDAAGVRAANALATRGLVPDLTLLLTCAPAVSAARVAARGAPDRLEQAGAAFHARVAAAFAQAADPAWQRAHPEVGPVALVDGDGPPAAVAARIMRAIGARWPALAETFGALLESQ